MENNSFVSRLLYKARDWRSKELFRLLKKYCQGKVLDVGGGNFFVEAKKRKISFSDWTILEVSEMFRPAIKEKNVHFIVGDGCKMSFKNNTFDAVCCIQVLEHVLEPLKMVQEISRVLKSKGYAIFLIPQTATLHLAPNHFCNFTRYWIFQAMKKNNLQIVKYQPLGGVWSSIASRSFYFFLQSFRFKGMTDKNCRRNILFYLLYPLMVVMALFSIIIGLFLSLGDLTEEPNNHLVVVRKIKE